MTSTGLCGLGVGPAEEAVLFEMEVIWAGFAVNAGGALTYGFGFGAGTSSCRTRTADWMADCGGPFEVCIGGEGTMRLEGGDGGTEEFCIFI